MVGTKAALTNKIVHSYLSKTCKSSVAITEMCSAGKVLKYTHCLHTLLIVSKGGQFCLRSKRAVHHVLEHRL